MKKSKGFTLIEVVVVAAIIAVMLSGVYVIFDQGVRMFAKDRTQVANQESIRTVMTSIEKKIRKANATTPIQIVSGCLVIYSTTTTDTYCQSGNSITLNTNAILDRISAFTYAITTDANLNYSVVITITSIADSMGQVNTLTETYNVRKGR